MTEIFCLFVTEAQQWHERKLTGKSHSKLVAGISMFHKPPGKQGAQANLWAGERQRDSHLIGFL
jgi:hypothetical protein